mmetsp:Transcript_51982/g.137541  ORF Transcript_51982/g.137541 Transcript_51982/m.137541 type:complete len:212 (+) Transcript_51982:652-1287(+)
MQLRSRKSCLFVRLGARIQRLAHGAGSPGNLTCNTSAACSAVGARWSLLQWTLDVAWSSPISSTSSRCKDFLSSSASNAKLADTTDPRPSRVPVRLEASSSSLSRIVVPITLVLAALRRSTSPIGIAVARWSARTTRSPSFCCWSLRTRSSSRRTASPHSHSRATSRTRLPDAITKRLSDNNCRTAMRGCTVVDTGGPQYNTQCGASGVVI